MEELLQVVLKRRPSEQQLVVDLVPVQNPEKLLRTSHKVGNMQKATTIRMMLDSVDTLEEQCSAVPWTGCSSAYGPRPPPSRPM